ncbi:MAG: glutathione S-transferase N-terminal domain-containing protein [Thermotogae bacterium]|nr:glutathione S-transferase N-terminal domain-containing protein [Thermotogota bacterium]MCL5031880.1 glutathione S-transferase N-terminal domain-containing protein [Thermotogota bacterium]
MALKVKIYSTPACPHCKAAKNYFKSLGIPFEDVDVSRDQREAERMVQKTHQYGVPVIELGNQIVIGFDRNKIDRILGVR